MKKFANYLMIILIVPALVLSSCKKDSDDEPENKAPTANAGVDQTVQMETEVTLDGTASSDPEGSALTYSWTEPAGITLSGTTNAQPTFTAPVVTEDDVEVKTETPEARILSKNCIVQRSEGDITKLLSIFSSSPISSSFTMYALLQGWKHFPRFADWLYFASDI